MIGFEKLNEEWAERGRALAKVAGEAASGALQVASQVLEDLSREVKNLSEKVETWNGKDRSEPCASGCAGPLGRESSDPHSASNLNSTSNANPNRNP